MLFLRKVNILEKELGKATELKLEHIALTGNLKYKVL